MEKNSQSVTEQEASRPSWFGVGDNVGCVMLSNEIRRLGVDEFDFTHPLVQEYAAREHIDGEIPMSQVARNNDIPLSAVRRWVDIFRREGRKGLEQAAQRRAKPSDRTKPKDSA